jgi:hypothetical protein
VRLYDHTVLSPSRPVPREALRDALDLARLLYAYEHDEPRRVALAEAGRLLHLALEQTHHEPGSLAHWAAELAQPVEAARVRVVVNF